MHTTRSTRRFTIFTIIALTTTLQLFASTLYAQTATDTAEKTESAQQRERTAARMKEMTAMIGGVQVDVVSEGETAEAKRKEASLLRTIDTKLSGLEDGSIWVFQHNGLPVAMVELWASRKTANHWGHTMLAVTSKEIVAKADGHRWAPKKGNGVAFKPLPMADAPQARPRLRKAQMRQYSRRFKVGKYRMLTEPIHRYQGGDVEDGGIFAFVRGQSNPEALLFLQSRDGKWEYGFLRCSSEALAAKLDEEEEVWRVKNVFKTPEGIGAPDQAFWVLFRPYETADN